MRQVWLLLILLSGWSFASESLSAGCGKPATEPLTHLTVAGVPRTFILELPQPYDPDRAYPLIFAFHGRTSPAEEVQGYYDLEAHAPDTLGPTIFVYPVALTQEDGTFSWWDSDDAPDALRDFTLFDALITRVQETYCVDTARIYAVGHSLGGSFVNALGCYRAEVLRAVASLGAGPSGGTCTGVVAAMVLHNPRDELVPFSLGQAARDQYLEQNDLGAPAQSTEPITLSCQRYGGPRIPDPVLWCPHTVDTSRGRFYPHNWPNETGLAVMRFFASLP